MYRQQKDIAGQLCIYGEIHGVPDPVKKETVITITVPEQIMATGYRTKIPNAAMSVYATTHIRHNDGQNFGSIENGRL